MIGTLMNSILGKAPEKEGAEQRGIGSLLVIGIVLFVLLGGLKLFQKPEDAPGGECD